MNVKLIIVCVFIMSSLSDSVKIIIEAEDVAVNGLSSPLSFAMSSLVSLSTSTLVTLTTSTLPWGALVRSWIDEAKTKHNLNSTL